MRNDAKDIIRKCLNDKIDEDCLIIKTDMKKLSLSQLENLNHMISDLEYAKTQLEGDK